MAFTTDLDYFEQIFLRQFERDGDRFLYRKHRRGAPVPVTAEEREAFRLQYRKSSRRMLWSAVLGMIALATLGVLIAPEFMGGDAGVIVISAGMIGFISIQSVRHSTAPARALERRTPVGEALTKKEVQTKHLATTSWPLLGTLFLVTTSILVAMLSYSEFEEWSDYLWTVGSAVLSALGARALWLKFRLTTGPH